MNLMCNQIQICQSSIKMYQNNKMHVLTSLLCICVTVGSEAVSKCYASEKGFSLHFKVISSSTSVA
jgi:hypothetical protein